MNLSVNINAMRAHSDWMAVNANNVANVNTEDFTANDTVITEGHVASIRPTAKETDLSKEIPDQIVIEKGFEAQTSAIRTQDEMLGTLLDMKA
jgi:flagellar hook protein FlgE